MSGTAVFISGRGSNMQNLLDFAGHSIRVIVASKITAKGIHKAKRMGVPVWLFCPEQGVLEMVWPLLDGDRSLVLTGPRDVTTKDTKNKSTTQTQAYAKLSQALIASRIDRIFLLGFMKLVPPEFCQKWEARMINIHPSLLPNYPGLHAMEKSFEDGAPLGVTLHWVSSEMDSGPRISQQSVRRRSTWVETQLKMAQAEQNCVSRFANAYFHRFWQQEEVGVG